MMTVFGIRAIARRLAEKRKAFRLYLFGKSVEPMIRIRRHAVEEYPAPRRSAIGHRWETPNSARKRVQDRFGYKKPGTRPGFRFSW